MKVMSRQARHTADTRQGLVDEARKLFARRGYHAASLDAVCAQAGVTKGALYHHFENKEDLFLAVLDDVEKDLVRAGTTDSEPTTSEPSGDVWDQLRNGCQAFLDVCVHPNTGRILVEARSALVWERARQVERRYLDLLSDMLAHAAAKGIIETARPDILAQLLFGLFAESASMIASAPDPSVKRRDVGRELDTILAGMRTANR
jgi:AcrR family transcriptional regulator